MTAGALKGPGKLAVAPILFATYDDKETVAFVHVGRGLCVSPFTVYCAIELLMDSLASRDMTVWYMAGCSLH